MPYVYFILAICFFIVLLLTYSSLVVSSKQLERARARYNVQAETAAALADMKNASESIVTF